MKTTNELVRQCERIEATASCVYGGRARVTAKVCVGFRAHGVDNTDPWSAEVRLFGERGGINHMLFGVVHTACEVEDAVDQLERDVVKRANAIANDLPVAIRESLGVDWEPK